MVLFCPGDSLFILPSTNEDYSCAIASLILSLESYSDFKNDSKLSTLSFLLTFHSSSAFPTSIPFAIVSFFGFVFQ